mmetsp:Transcript_101285/g.326876  ORF Transcript_101285/g.326876 Transcript_101285/m.326876 type:complete len:331 (-) Transcript_101285:59-1051(-)
MQVAGLRSRLDVYGLCHALVHISGLHDRRDVLGLRLLLLQPRGLRDWHGMHVLRHALIQVNGLRDRQGVLIRLNGPLDRHGVRALRHVLMQVYGLRDQLGVPNQLNGLRDRHGVRVLHHVLMQVNGLRDQLVVLNQLHGLSDWLGVRVLRHVLMRHGELALRHLLRQANGLHNLCRCLHRTIHTGAAAAAGCAAPRSAVKARLTGPSCGTTARSASRCTLRTGLEDQEDLHQGLLQAPHIRPQALDLRREAQLADGRAPPLGRRCRRRRALLLGRVREHAAPPGQPRAAAPVATRPPGGSRMQLGPRRDLLPLLLLLRGSGDPQHGWPRP